jgi:D-alanyl-D-alanine dipeptidase
LAQNTPPKEQNKREADLIELIKLDKSIKLDIRYATANNFVGRAVYPEARAFLQRPAADGVVRVHKLLKKQGRGIVVYDGYRPWTITKLFWEVVPEDKRGFVANPATGSKHNRGCAIDLSIYDLRTGKPIPMSSAYDEFTERASPDYTGGSDEERANRDMLRRMMEAEGFTVNPNEWWHFDYKDWKQYAIYDIAFSAIRNLDELKGLNVRRVEIVGNDHVSGRTIFRHIYLNEGDIFTEESLLKSVKAINALGRFEKISEQNVSWRISRQHGEIDFTFFLTEKRKN